MERPHGRRISVVGIDGSGKSTAILRLVELGSSLGGEVSVFTCPAYHRTPDAPLADLSRALDRLGIAADRLGSFELKAAALYLQMTLYGPVEGFFRDTWSPRVLVSERNAIVDSLAYGPFYGRMVRTNLDPGPTRTAVERELGGSEGFDPVLAWHAAECRRLGLEVSFWDLPVHVRGIFELPWERRVEDLGRRFRSSLPDVVLFLDVPPDEAVRRIAARGGAERELHESAKMLGELRASYRAVLDALSKHAPGTECRIVDTMDPGATEAAIRDALGRPA